MIKGYNDVELAILIKHFEMVKQIRSNKELRLKKKPATTQISKDLIVREINEVDLLGHAAPPYGI